MDSERALLHSLSARAFANQASDPALAAPTKVKNSDSAPIAPVQAPISAPVKVESKTALSVTASERPVQQEAKVVKKQEAAPLQQAKVEQTSVKKPVATGEVEILKNSNSNLRRELQTAQSRIEELERSLDQARSQLTLTETELTRLSTRLDTKNRASLGKYNLPIANNQGGSKQGDSIAGGTHIHDTLRQKAPIGDVKPPAANTDMHVATVAVDKADLRLGPGKNHSALMAVPRGSRLVIETRQGEWYRVFAPSGERAWIQAGMVLFGDGASLLNDGTAARVKGFNPNDEEEAFRRVQRITAGQ
jgi:FtsZ-binding cell division protein ZapB